ncbi:MAG TPA: very short patch repair endonuclease [Solirubrobacterales bacterium]|nr:very short patch repair endonuclease [Solirubrobacterales bacterium]
MSAGKISKYPVPSSPGATATMRANRRIDTRPEILLRSALHRRGLRFRKDVYLRVEGVRTKADIVFASPRIVVYVDGCFWHSCPKHGQLPKANQEYWHPKLARNVERDQEVNRALQADGWTVLRAWEHEPVEQVAQRVYDAVKV